MKSYIKSIEEGGISASLRKDGIVHLIIQDHTHVTIEMLEGLIERLNQLTDDKIPLIVEGGDFITISQEAKNFAKDFESRAHISSRAILTKNLAQKILVNYYYKSQKLNKPFKEFDKMDDAEKWLKQNNDLNDLDKH